jgi:hypothetical protein
MPHDMIDGWGRNRDFNRLLELIEDLDNADDFRKMGGFDLCLIAITSIHPGVQWQVAHFGCTPFA